MTRVYLAIGSNLGDRQAALARAIQLLGPSVTIDAQSRIFETAPMYVRDQPAFLNMVVAGETDLAPLPLLDLAKRLEGEIGRVPSRVNGPRAIDIDILYHGDTIMVSHRLTLPHPRIAERAFVLVPLADIAPDLSDPVTGITVAAMRDAVDRLDEVRPLP